MKTAIVAVHLVALACAASAALLPARAAACGGFFCQSVPVDQTGEQILFAVEGDQVEAHVQIQYQGAAENFSWIVPTPSRPEVGISSAAVFTRMQQLAGIRFELDWTYDDDCDRLYPPMAGGTTDDTRDEDGSGVTVVQQAQVGPFDYSVLQATDTEALFDWLAANDYTIPDAALGLVEPYVLMGDQMHFVAFKLQKDASVGEIQPVLLRYVDDQPMIPIQLTAIATQPNLGVTVGLLGGARAVPENYLHVEINEARIDWLSSGDNYDALIDDAMDEAGGQAFTTEYAGPTTPFSGAFFAEGRLQTARLATIDDPAAFVDAVQQEGFAADPQLLDVLERFIPVPAELAAQGVDARTFFNNIGSYASYLEGRAFDAAGCADELESRIAAPLRHAQALFDRLPYFTRLHTSLSADEMTVDPVFAFNDDLPTVSNVRRASARLACDPGTPDLSSAPVIVTLDDGRQILTSYAAPRDALDAMPGAASISQLASSGEPVPVARTDGRIPDVELVEYNAEYAQNFPGRDFDFSGGQVVERKDASGCAAAGGFAGAWSFVAVAGLLLRRRRR
jgi:hypothetical protein